MRARKRHAIAGINPNAGGAAFGAESQGREFADDAADDASVPLSATFIAAPLSDGVVSERWDGTVRLRVELDVAATQKPSDAPLDVLSKFLFATNIKSGDGSALASGLLTVGTTAFPLKWMTVVEPSINSWNALNIDGSPSAGPGNNETLVWRSYVDLALDPWPAAPPLPVNPGGSHAELVAALNTGSVPTAELRLTLHPASDRNDDMLAVTLGKPIALTAPTQNDPGLTFGTDRPPVTLHWSLFAVTTDRGGMPLLPSTLLFVDPAYEAGLANPPYEASALVDTTKVGNLPKSRGAVRAVFAADRSRVNRTGSIAFMIDVRFERPAPSLAPTKPTGSDLETDGDLVVKPEPTSLVLSLRLIPHDTKAPVRDLNIAGAAVMPEIDWAKPYELSLASLTEQDGSPVQLSAGDVLVLTVCEKIPSNAADSQPIAVTLWNSESGQPTAAIPLRAPKAKPFAQALNLVLTDEAVIEPPPALYAAMVLSKHNDSIGVPLHAQSPLPWRIDFRDLKADFRKGLIQRSATFVWALARSVGDFGKTPIHCYVLKSDRNGQTYLPDNPNEFLSPDRPGPK